MASRPSPGPPSLDIFAKPLPGNIIRMARLGGPGEGLDAISTDGKPLHYPFRFANLRALINEGTPPRQTSFGPEEPLVNFKGVTVLVAEDNMVNQKVIQSLLVRLGCTVHIVSDGSQAIAACKKFNFDLVFMDCQMPVMDGYEATAVIRAMAGGHLPVIAITANAMPGEREKCLLAGMHDCLSKPISEKQIRDVLQSWVAKVYRTHSHQNT